MHILTGSPIRHIEAARNGREKGGRWSISALFRKKSATTKGLGSEMTEIIYNHDGCSSTGGGSAGIVENNGIIRRGSDAHQYGGYSNVIKANIETPPPLPPRASSRGRVSGHQPPPAIFPHLKPDFGYPDAQPAGQGFYFHPSYGYVRRGSYSDNQVYIAVKFK